MRPLLNRASEWIATHPWIVVSTTIGVALGILISLPILQVEFPKGIDTLIGAAVGSFLAVGSAAWLSSAKERRNRSEARDLVIQTASPLRDAYRDALHTYHQFESENRGSGTAKIGKAVVVSKFSIVESKAGALKRRLPDIREVFFAIGPIGHLAYSDAERVTAEMTQNLSAWAESALDELDSGGSEHRLLAFLGQYMSLDQTLQMVTSGKRPTSGMANVPDFMRTDPRFKFPDATGGT